MFNSHGTDRLTEWKEFRNKLEESVTPLEDVSKFWSYAPFVSPYLNPHNSANWPDPWHLILDSRLDQLAIVLGMLYTVKLTQRFATTPCEIHMSKMSSEREPTYFLIVNNEQVLNLEYNSVVDVAALEKVKTNMIWSGSKIK